MSYTSNSSSKTQANISIVNVRFPLERYFVFTKAVKRKHVHLSSKNIDFPSR